MKILRKIKKVSGETLIEAIMALAILGVTGAAASALIIASVQTTILSGKYLVAQSLAVEGVEAVKNIVYTNIMMHPEDNTCWFDAVPTTSASCPNTEMYEGAFYYPEQVPDAYKAVSWKVTEEVGGVTGGDDPTLIGIPKFALCTGSGTYVGCGSALPQENSYYRAIKVLSKNLVTGELKLFVRVQWRIGGKVNSFDMKNVTITTNQE